MRSIKRWPGLLGYSKIGDGFFATQARKRFSLALLLDFTFVDCNKICNILRPTCRLCFMTLVFTLYHGEVLRVSDKSC